MTGVCSSFILPISIQQTWLTLAYCHALTPPPACQGRRTRRPVVPVTGHVWLQILGILKRSAPKWGWHGMRSVESCTRCTSLSRTSPRVKVRAATQHRPPPTASVKDKLRKRKWGKNGGIWIWIWIHETLLKSWEVEKISHLPWQLFSWLFPNSQCHLCLLIYFALTAVTCVLCWPLATLLLTTVAWVCFALAALLSITVTSLCFAWAALLLTTVTCDC